MAYDRLALYNEALRICGERSLSALTEAREPRYLLDQVWDEGGVRGCLEEGQWKFAMRSVMIDHDTSVSPAFGYRFGFSKPSDWVRTAGVCSDEFFRSPLLEYTDEVGYWYADTDPIYVRFVSDDSGFGGDMSIWPGTYRTFVAAHFARKVIYKLTSDEARREEVKKALKEAKRDALNKDAMNGPTVFPARGSWTNARAAGGRRRDGGNRGSLIG